MRLLHTSASPFAAKVRLAAVQCDIAFDEETVVDTVAEQAELLDANPLGKIPAVLLHDGEVLYDSVVICDYLDRLSGNRIVPQTDAGWRAAKRLEATVDGVLDAAILILYEGRFRPEDRRHEPWVDRQWRKALRGLAKLEAEVGEVPAVPTIGHLALASLTTWLGIRFAGQWEQDHPKLVAWRDGFFEAFPKLDAVKPRL